jgi:hypothetical protein
MADAETGESTAEAALNEGGVLGNLPRTRPQRATPRRAAAREAASSNGGPPGRAGRSISTASTSDKAARGRRKAQPAKGAVRTEAKRGAAQAARGPAAVADSAATKQARAAGSATRSSNEPRARRSPAAKHTGSPHRSLSAEQPAPRQGYECEGERAEGPVQPPGGPELLASAAELVGELAKAGISVGERLLRDAHSRLPGG